MLSFFFNWAVEKAVDRTHSLTLSLQLLELNYIKNAHASVLAPDPRSIFTKTFLSPLSAIVDHSACCLAFKLRLNCMEDSK